MTFDPCAQAAELQHLTKQNEFLQEKLSFQVHIFKKMEFELYAQMCPPSICEKNLVFFQKLTKKINKNLKNINKHINVILDIQLYTNLKT